jgi:hypothetical protein
VWFCELTARIAAPRAEQASMRHFFETFYGAGQQTVPVLRDPDDGHRVALHHVPSGRRVVPVDLGFLNTQMRPPLHHLLARFRPATDAAFPFPTQPEPAAPPRTPVDAGAAADGGVDAAALAEAAGTARDGVQPADGPGRQPRVVRRPRIRFGESLILSRATWFVPDALFPALQPGESESGYFRRVQAWRVEHGLPARAFLRVAVHPRPAPPPPPSGLAQEGKAAEPRHNHAPKAGRPGAAARRTAPSRDLYKPQYIDFGSPLLVALLGKLVPRQGRFTVQIEEALPDAGELVSRGGERYATEFVLQIDLAQPKAARTRTSRRGRTDAAV